MKKLILSLMLVLGTALGVQAQTFDFSCEATQTEFSVEDIRVLTVTYGFTEPIPGNGIYQLNGVDDDENVFNVDIQFYMGYQASGDDIDVTTTHATLALAIAHLESIYPGMFNRDSSPVLADFTTTGDDNETDLLLANGFTILEGESTSLIGNNSEATKTIRSGDDDIVIQKFENSDGSFFYNAYSENNSYNKENYTSFNALLAVVLADNFPSLFEMNEIAQLRNAGFREGGDRQDGVRIINIDHYAVVISPALQGSLAHVSLDADIVNGSISYTVGRSDVPGDSDHNNFADAFAEAISFVNALTPGFSAFELDMLDDSSFELNRAVDQVQYTKDISTSQFSDDDTVAHITISNNMFVVLVDGEGSAGRGSFVTLQEALDFVATFVYVA